MLALQRSDLQRALALQQEVIAWLQKNPEGTQYFRATSLAVLAKIQVMADQPKAALASTQSAIAIFRTLPSSTNGMQAQLAAILQMQGMLEAQQGELNAALASTDESVSLLKSLLPGDSSVRSSLIASLMNRSAMHLAMVNSAEAIRSSEEALAILRELVQQYPEQRFRLASLLRNLSIMAQDLGRMKTALSYGQESVSIFLSLIKTQPDLKSSLSRSQEQVESVKGEMLPAGAPAHVPPLVTAFIAQLRSGAIQAAVDSLMQPIYKSNQDNLNSLPADEAKKALSGMDFLRELVLSNLQSDVNRNG